MSALIPQHEIDRISQGADIVSIVESYGVKLRRQIGITNKNEAAK